MNRYLLEIGTEELPAGFLESAPGELADKVKTALSEQNLPYTEVKVYATPRRLALLIDGLPELQESTTSKIKGPPTRVALDANGAPTQAGLGFAKKMGIDFSQLQQETLDGETYLVLNQTIAGRPTQAVLTDILPDLILGLSGSHFMYWGHSTIKFSRPIRWLVSVWNDQHLPFQLGDIPSSTVSQGHRVLADGPVEISSVDAYATVLEQQGKVLVNQARRQETIWAQIQQAASALGGYVSENQGLLETVNMLVEHPSVIAGRFEERFLEIPKEVITTVMAAHQKYFPVEKPGSEELLPYFLTVSNGLEASASNIQHGNERVLTARLEDARFFFEEDRKVSLEERVEALRGITFQKGLGSLYDKTQRLMTLSQYIAQHLGYAPSDIEKAQRAAKLSKADLMTGMVRELTELQGVMGRKYALLSGEDASIGEALFEQYLPRSMGDAVACNPIGIVLSLADKLDTMVAVFSQKNAKLPSGSKDPLGLRRMAGGMIQIVLENKLRVNLKVLVQAAYKQLGAMASTEEDTTLELVRSFIVQRFKGVLLERNIRYDIIDAVLDARDPLEDLLDAWERMEILKALSQSPETLKQLYEPANRIYRILGDAYRPEATVVDISPAHLTAPSEQALLQALKEMPGIETYPALLSALQALGPAVESFFEQVLVNDPDAAIRQNRYNLLSVLNGLYLRLACFTRLVVQ